MSLSFLAFEEKRRFHQFLIMKRIFFAYLTFEFFFVLATLLTISCGRYHRAQLEYKLGEGDLLIYNATVSIFGQLGKLSNLNYQTAQTILLLVVAKDADASYRFGQISHGHDYFFGREKLEPLSNFCRYSQGALNISGPVAKTKKNSNVRYAKNILFIIKN